jgi:hypothetical protein
MNGQPLSFSSRFHLRPLLLGAALTIAALAGCGGGGGGGTQDPPGTDPPGTNPPLPRPAGKAPKPTTTGQSEFEAGGPAGGGFAGDSNRAGAGTSAPSGPGAAPAPSVPGMTAPTPAPPPTGNPSTPAPAGPPRLIEEGDIVKLVGKTLYVLNQYRGVQVIDLSNPDAPVLLSRAPLYGTPLEMYVRGGTVFALVSDYWNYWRCPTCDGGSRSFHGSTMAVVDVSNPRAAAVKAEIDIEGVVNNSRLVGNVLYTVSDRYASWYWAAKSSDNLDLTFIQSVDVTDPANPKVVDRKDFPRQGWQNHISVTDRLLYVASSGYGYWYNDVCMPPKPPGSTGGGAAVAPPPAMPTPTPVKYSGPCSHITAVDISSPAGRIMVGTSIDVEGYIQDRWAMDWFQDTFRLVSHNGWNNVANPPMVRTYAARNASELRPLGTAPIILSHPEQVTTTRFDGARAFVVTAAQIDPLWTIDLANPERPFIAGHLETPGWLTFIEPRGDKLVALGRDRQTTTSPLELHVSMYDVSNLAKPTMIKRELFGGGWASVPGQSDDIQKVFKVIDELGLIMVPYQAWVQDKTDLRRGGHQVYGVQLFDFDVKAGSMAIRGLIEHPGFVQRAIPYMNRIITMSNELIQVLDATDRSKPRLTGGVELARNVADVAIAGGTTVELVGDYYQGDTSLYVVPTTDPNSPTPRGKFSVAAPNGRIFANGNFAYLLSQDRNGQSSQIDVVETGDAPRKRGTLSIPWPSTYVNYYGYFWGGFATGATQVGGTSLVLSFNRVVCPQTSPPVPTAPGGVSAPSPAPRPPCMGPDADFYVIDLRDPDRPVVSAKITLPGALGVYGAGVSGTTFYASHYEPFEDEDALGKKFIRSYRQYLDRIDLADPARPVVAAKLNVPGHFLAARGDLLFTTDTTYSPSTGRPFTTLYSLYQPPGMARAYLQGSLLLDGTAGFVVDGNAAFTVIDGELLAVDLVDFIHPRVVSRTPIPGVRRLSQGGSGDVAVAYPGGGIYYSYSAGIRSAVGGYVFVTVDSGLLVFDAHDVTRPVFDQFARTQGWVQQIRVAADGSRALLPSGYYGVSTIELGAVK